MRRMIEQRLNLAAWSKRLLPVFLGVVMSGVVTGCIGAGVNSEMTPAGPAQFPRVTGINLNGRSIAVPHDLEGDPRIVVVAFEQAQQRDVDTWLTALSPDLAAAPTLKLYELPVIYTGSAAFRFWVNNGMRSGITDETARNRTVTVYTDREKFFAELGVKRESITTFVLGASGEIRWRADGPAAPETLSSLRRILAEPHGSSTPPDGSR